ncbi:hypothetical protein [Calidifontibacillus oryziterrae]|uniref:hypothetical protein n=1 Tax=Calidifontibacillus oryziterrae TaxID=1191699 RepID=UPI0002F0013F|nr:hypothetical protein [Calidifontibacillus oryziterrae]
MAEEMFNDKKNEFQEKSERQDDNNFMEETAAEVAPRLDRATEEVTGGAGMGAIALALSLLSLFFAPVLMGAAGIIVGFIARRRGATGLGSWAIGIGAVSMLIALFVRPFYY